MLASLVSFDMLDVIFLAVAFVRVMPLGCVVPVPLLLQKGWVRV